MILDPNLLRMLQAQGPDFFKKSQPIDPELMQRRNRALPMPVPAQRPHTEHVVDYKDAMAQAQYDQAPPDRPQAPPRKPQGYIDRLVNDPKRMGLLRYGLGVLGGERPGTAMDRSVNTYQGMNTPMAPKLQKIPVGNNEFAMAQWMGPNYQDDTVPGFPRGWKRVGGVGPYPQTGANLGTTQMRNFEYAKNNPEFEEFLKKTGLSKTPAAIQEWNMFDKLDEAGQRKYLAMKRAGKHFDLGGSQYMPDPLNPAGKPLANIPKTLKPGEEPKHLFKAAGVKIAGKRKEERLQEDIDVGVRNADATIVVRRNLDILKILETGGFDAARIKFKAMFGRESADEAELMRNMGIAVLQQIRPIFGAQPSEREGRILLQLEQGIGKSTKGNVRLLKQALKQLERLADIGLNAAVTSRDYRTANRIQEALKFDLSKDIEAAPKEEPTVQEKLQDLSDEEFRRKYDSRRK